jgi:hypothetical protein
LDQGRAWVGFTRLRQTKFKEKVAWVKHGLREHRRPTHVALYDLAAKKCLKEINLEEYGMNAVFSILTEASP